MTGPGFVPLMGNGTVPIAVGGHRWAFDMNLDMTISESFSSSFFMILATEMGDETFIIAAVMAMRHPKATVLGGALSALYFMTVLSAGLGIVLPNLISHTTVHNCATVLYTFFGLRLMYIGAKGEGEDKDEEFEEVENTLKDSAGKSQKTLVRRLFSKFCTPIFLEALMLTFLAEWGDRSQIATITLASHQNPIGVILGACIGHTICTSLAVFGGEWLGKRISQRLVAFGGGFLFMLFALINCFTSAPEPAHVNSAATAITTVIAGVPSEGVQVHV
mmetsp:Transcript_100069/g.158360  ORF Transcript_100069/g.158360 Transcript_100069/m.158360 type:complete len:276 (+) Transcript_100069:71-898(+)|eukprot:CAMPEP_0169084252 /NCGR_PEP_ID=MMETSP1015-20121227/12522_1 /TAXON_ID=342587 /ORGANISM="Karlodinium micrum, Strain CCMP2283" /LENGTH=275 /DNA_ID=CAMNT_0009144249 /DNA_START=60 /DNA_END=887 /DNA_ORIENTATION=-